jgi:hypothetical protein
MAAILSACAEPPFSTPLLTLRAPDDSLSVASRRYFEETGFDVSGEFLKHFESHGGLEIFGYPISAVYNHQGVMVQYFQKARMEWHVVGPNANTMVLGNLGEELALQAEGLSNPVRSTRRRLYFEETQHTVSLFLKYYQAYGGVDFFGLPITEMVVEDQKIVQYFQRIKLVCDPRTMRISTGSLGDLYVKTYRDSFPPNVLKPIELQYGENSTLNLLAHLGVRHTTLSMDHVQSTVIVVYNQSEESSILPDANVTIKLFTRSGTPIPNWSYVGSTDADGRMEAEISLEQFNPGDVIIVKAEVGYGTARTDAETSFVIWW